MTEPYSHIAAPSGAILLQVPTELTLRPQDFHATAHYDQVPVPARFAALSAYFLRYWAADPVSARVPVLAVPVTSTSCTTASETAVPDVWTFLERTGLGDLHTIARERLGVLGDSVAEIEVALGRDEDLGGDYAELRVWLDAGSRAEYRDLRSRAMDELLVAFEGRDLSRVVIALLPKPRT